MRCAGCAPTNDAATEKVVYRRPYGRLVYTLGACDAHVGTVAQIARAEGYVVVALVDPDQPIMAELPRPSRPPRESAST